MILDCSGVEIATSEIINLLMRVRNHAKQLDRELVLFNVPDTLATLIKLCNLESILLSEGDEQAARNRVSERAKGNQ